MNTSTAHKPTQNAAAVEPQLPFAASAPAAEAWLQRLSALSYGDACRHLYGALRTLNRMELAAHPRFQLLEILRPRVLELSNRLESYFVDQAFPLEDKIAKVVRLAIQFQAELALGYQRVLDAPAYAEAFSGMQQATAAQRALTAYGLYLLRCAQSYEAPSAKIWQRVYGAYRRAESLGVADEQVNDLDCNLAASASASESLRKIALFQLAHPTRLPQREIGELYEWLDRNPHLVGLQRERAFNLQEAHFYLNLSEAAMPQPIGALAMPNAETRYLFLQPMLLELLQSGIACPTFGLCVARRLMPGTDGWNAGGQSLAVLFATGTEGAAALFDANVETVKRRLNGLDSKPLELCPPNVNPRAALSVRVAHYLPNGRVAPEPVSRDDIWGASEPEAVAVMHGSQGWLRYYDDEARALLIADRQHLRIGQLVAMASEDAQPAIGVIRAINPATDERREWADVEILQGVVTTARAYIEGEKRRRLPCLLLTGEHGLGGITSVMLLPTAFANGTWITLEQNGKWTNQRLARLIEATDDFCQYHLVAVE